MTSGHENKYSFFDPKTPPSPEEILGIPTMPLVELGATVGSLLLMAPYWEGKPIGVWTASQRGKHALPLFPLIERLQAGEQLKPEDVRPYRKPIKKAVPKLGTIDKLAALSSGLIIGIPLRKRLNRKIENDFPKRAPEVLRRAREQSEAYLPRVEPEVNFLAEFENPRAEFVSELGIVTEAIRQVALARAQSQRHDEVTANDAGYGIRSELGRLVLNREESKDSLPLFSHFILDKVPDNTKLPEEKIFSIVAPEIMDILEAALPKDQRDSEFLNSILRHPHSMRAIGSKMKGSQFRELASAVTLLPNIRNLLPTTGQEVTDRFERVKNFLAGFENT